jgi:hypothetical protein
MYFLSVIIFKLISDLIFKFRSHGGHRREGFRRWNAVLGIVGESINGNCGVDSIEKMFVVLMHGCGVVMIFVADIIYVVLAITVAIMFVLLMSMV